MDKKLKTIIENSTSVLIEKKSKFIAAIFKVNSEQEAIDVIKRIKKDNRKATHNVYAYIVLEEGQVVARYSDDKEPSRNSRQANFIFIKSKRFM